MSMPQGSLRQLRQKGVGLTPNVLDQGEKNYSVASPLSEAAGSYSSPATGARYRKGLSRDRVAQIKSRDRPGGMIFANSSAS